MNTTPKVGDMATTVSKVDGRTYCVRITRTLGVDMCEVGVIGFVPQGSWHQLGDVWATSNDNISLTA